MKKSIFTMLIISLFVSTSSSALSPGAIEGKALYPTCHICHNPELAVPLGPPMWGVQRLYKKGTLDNEDFVQRMVSFVKAPTLEAALHGEALKQMGLMPALPLPDAMLQSIATYILEESFPPPCSHWSIAVKKATVNGDEAHAAKDLRMLNKFCR